MKYWNHTFELVFWACIHIISLICTIMFLVLMITRDFYWMSFAAFLLIFLISLSVLFFNKRLLTKIEFNKRGLKLLRFKKEIKFIEWNDIFEAKETIRSRALSWLTFVSNKGNINLEVYSKSMYETIISNCPKDSLKNMINNIEYFNKFHKE